MSSGGPPRFRLSNAGTLEVHEERPAERFLVAPGAYHPKLTLHPSGRLVVMFREGDFHFGQRARVCVSLSDDGGESWSYSIPIDPRGPDEKLPAIGALPDGTLLASFVRQEGYFENGRRRLPPPRVVDCLLSRSVDGGETWSRAEPIESLRGQPYGGFGRIVVTPGGDALLCVYSSSNWGPAGTAYGVCFVRSSDGGRTWSAPQEIAADYGETSLLALPGGTLLAAVRHTKRGIVAITRSEDEGLTWSDPDVVTTPVQMPGDLLALADGRVLLTYGRRIAPFGVRAILSRDGGRTWNTERRVTLVADPITRDCGYPSSAQLADGSIVTAYYAAESNGFWQGSFGWHAGPDRLGPHVAVVKYRPEDLP